MLKIDDEKTYSLRANARRYSQNYNPIIRGCQVYTKAQTLLQAARSELSCFVAVLYMCHCRKLELAFDIAVLFHGDMV